MRKVRDIAGSSWIVLCTSLFLWICLVAFRPNSAEVFQLQYPLNFGSRFVIPADNPLTKEGVALGRYLFYEPALSKNNSVSCASCHQQKFAFADSLRFSKGVDGSLTKRNSMSLANLLWVRNFFWDGRTQGLEAQAVFPLTDPHEMGQALDMSAQKLRQLPLYPPLFAKAFGSPEITPDRITKAIAQFERTLISANSKYDQYLAGTYQPTEQEKTGMMLFMTTPDPAKGIRGANCEHCHGTPKMFKELFHDNGLGLVGEETGRMSATGNETDRGRFRVPTLRNIALTGPYMHDGRFGTLEEVLDHYSDHVLPTPNLSSFIRGMSNQPGGSQLSLTQAEKRNIIAFLHMLTDSTFTNSPAFSNPHHSLN